MNESTTNAVGADSPPAAPLSEAALFLEFIRNRDVPCPRCGYNLRNLTTTTCPECQEPLLLTVGAERFSLIGFIVTLTPSMFMIGLVAFLTLAMMASGGGGEMPTGICLLDGFGLASGVSALLLASNARRFLRLKPGAQAGWAILTWTIHGLVFILAIVGMRF